MVDKEATLTLEGCDGQNWLLGVCICAQTFLNIQQEKLGSCRETNLLQDWNQEHKT